MLSARCKNCNKELVGTTKPQACGCSNMMVVHGDNLTAVDLSKVVLLNSENNLNDRRALSNQDLQYQENRRKRKVRKLDFEER